jgi:hypothetical protein
MAAKSVCIGTPQPTALARKCKACLDRVAIRELSLGPSGGMRTVFLLCPACLRQLGEELAREANPAILAAIEKGMLVDVRPDPAA